jgi:hypothetical protein
MATTCPSCCSSLTRALTKPEEMMVGHEFSIFISSVCRNAWAGYIYRSARRHQFRGGRATNPLTRGEIEAERIKEQHMWNDPYLRAAAIHIACDLLALLSRFSWPIAST